MPFVRKNEMGDILSVHGTADLQDVVEVAGDDPAFITFLETQRSASEFEKLDLDFIRVIEDVIYLMIEKRLIVLTDLPSEAQHKLAERRNMRGKAGDLGNIVGSSDEFYLP